MSEFRFAEPAWAHAFYALAVFVGLVVWLERRGGGALDRFVSSALQERLVESPGRGRRRLRIALLSLSAVFLILALMRPQWGMRYVAAQTFGAEIMVCIDVSRSMLAEDVAPSRLDRAKAEIADLLAYMDGNQVGLIAFAGRATVLSPMTPDFGFLRLVLDGVGVHSVTRGGTRLEEPIRMALAGFGPPGPAARAILLITDGEDIDSFPLDAARAAAELGVRIVAIGFGDEAGSEIYVSHPGSGARELLRDANGQPVHSRLDGDLLREIALATQGAYVPAGTGLLDLESIYDEHIARLTRGELSERGKLAREEIYQWAVLAGLIFLVSSVAVPLRRTDAGRFAGDRARSSVLLALLLPLALQGPARAQPEAGGEVILEALEGELPPEDAEAREATPEPEDPREVYNQGIAVLAVDLEEAERGFRKARREAAGDGVLRFHSAYNLGWTLAERAGGLQEDEPEQALQMLYEAADWFREGLRLDPEHDGARHNLEVALNRALLLADALAKRGEDDLAARLEALAAGQRRAAASVAGLLEQLAADTGPHVSEPLRAGFRAAATAQRALLSDADQLAREVSGEFEAIGAKAEADRTSEDQMRAAQLEGLLLFMHRARERMGQSRQQLRRRQAERAYRRAAAALDELKRAQDQLRDPVAVLDRVIGSASEIASYTSLLSASQGRLSPGAETAAPAWLTRDYLVEAQESTAARTAQLHARLEAGLSQPPATEGAAAAIPPQVLSEAAPLVAEGHAALDRAARSLEADLVAALEAQARGIAALREARERFLDLRGLIEAIYADEKRIDAVLSSEEEAARQALAEFLPSLRAGQQKNLDRAARLDGLLRDATLGLESAGAEEQDAEALAAERRRLETAGTLLELASGEMQDAHAVLAAKSKPVFDTAAQHAGRAVGYLESLRRLFFSTVERIREIAERQLELADSTRDVAALAEEQALAERLGPLLPRQKSLSEKTETLAFALEEQSREAPADADPAQAEETTRRLRLAAEHLLLAQDAMNSASTALEGEPPVFDQAQEGQDGALVELAKALEQLVPPEQRQQPPQQQNPGDSSQQASQPQDGEESERGQQEMDPAQLLQGVRDREAQRREQRESKRHAGYDTVERDW